MPFVSITRRLRRLPRFMRAFVLPTWRTRRQVRCAPGLPGGGLLPDRDRAFRTPTLWRDQADMRRPMTERAHRQAMPRLPDGCDKARMVHWAQAGEAPPGRDVAEARMRHEAAHRG